MPINKWEEANRAKGWKFRKDKNEHFLFVKWAMSLNFFSIFVNLIVYKYENKCSINNVTRNQTADLAFQKQLLCHRAL